MLTLAELCVTCVGRAHPAGAAYCHRCGRAVNEVRPGCRSCGGPVRRKACYCAVCLADARRLAAGRVDALRVGRGAFGLVDYQARDDAKLQTAGRRGLLLRVLGPTREQAWRQLAGQIDATYVRGGLWRGDTVVAAVGPWAVTLDAYSAVHGGPTRVRAPFASGDGFRFTVARGVPQEAVSNDKAKAAELLADAEVRRLLASLPGVRLEVRDEDGCFRRRLAAGRVDLPVDELCVSAAGIVKDVDRLRHMFELSAVVLDRLCRLGTARAVDPGVLNRLPARFSYRSFFRDYGRQLRMGLRGV